MTYFDLPLDELTEYLPDRTEQPDFDDFWASTLREARELARPAELRPAFPELRALDVFDVTFSGFAGSRSGRGCCCRSIVSGACPRSSSSSGTGAAGGCRRSGSRGRRPDTRTS